MSTEEQTKNSAEPGKTWGNPPKPLGPEHQPHFFTFPELTQCLDLLLNLTENTTLIPLVKGQEGAGKTTLLFQYQSRAAEHWSLCRIDANPMLHPQQLYNRLAQHFGITEENDQFKTLLLRHIATLHLDGILPVLVIDDAQLLPAETLAELLQLHAATENSNPVIHIALFATPEINNLLLAPEVRIHNTQVIQTLDIPALSSEQATDYITQAVAGRDALKTCVLTTGQIENIFQASRGTPGRIESLLHDLHTHSAKSLNTTGKPILKLLLKNLPVPAVLGSVVLITVILILLIFQQEINAVFNGNTQLAETQTTTAPETLQEITLALPSEEKPQITPKPEPTTVEEPEPIKEIRKEKPALEPTEKISLKEANIPISIASANPVQAIETSLPIQTPTIPAPQKILPRKKPTTIKAAPAAVIKKPPENTKKAPVFVTSKTDVKREQWLLRQKPTTYTLQLISLKDEPTIRAFIKQHKLQGKVAYFKTISKGQSWFALLYGVFPNRKTAVSAQSTLPKKLRKPDIWTRSLESVHASIYAQ